MQVFVPYSLSNLESPDRLPENRIPDGESGIWPETSINLMQPSFSQSALEQLSKKKYRNCYQGNITITISFEFVSRLLLQIFRTFEYTQLTVFCETLWLQIAVLGTTKPNAISLTLITVRKIQELN